MRRLKSSDPEPLPLDCFTDRTRAVEITMPRLQGVKGLGMAVLIRAVGDGCNCEWLERIARAYEIEVPDGMLRRRPRYVTQTANGKGYEPQEDRPSTDYYLLLIPRGFLSLHRFVTFQSLCLPFRS
jgi:hypothetical protein